LTGRPPFTSDLALELMSSHAEVSPPSLESVVGRRFLPDAMEVVIAKLLRKNPEERYRTLSELKSDLEPIAARQEIVPAQSNRANENMLPPPANILAKHKAQGDPSTMPGLGLGLATGLILGLSISLMAVTGACAYWFFAEKNRAQTAVRANAIAAAAASGNPGSGNSVTGNRVFGNPPPGYPPPDKHPPGNSVSKSDQVGQPNFPAIKDSIRLPSSATALSAQQLVDTGNALIKADETDWQNLMPARYFMVAAEKDPTLRSAYSSLAGFYWSQHFKATAPEKTTLVEKCLVVANEELKHFPDDVDAHIQRINLYTTLGQWPEALADAERALKLEPGRKTLHLQHAWVLRKLHRNREAIVEFEKYIGPEDIGFMCQLCNSYQELHEDQKAIEFCSKWLKLLGPKDRLLTIRADSEKKLSMYKEALKDYQALVRLRPDQRAIHEGEIDYCKKIIATQGPN